MYILRPAKDEIEKYVGCTNILSSIPTPTYNSDEWFNSHRDFVLRVLLPQIKPPEKCWRIVAEAYLTDVYLEKSKHVSTFEQSISDGSSVVPDYAYKWGRIKDPWAMGHDLIYMLHKLKMPDAYNHNWKFKEANDVYRDGWLASKEPLIGWLWWSGLMLGGWVSWNSELNIPEPVTKILFKSEFKNE